MKHKGMLFVSFIFLMVSLVTLWGCPKKTEVTTSPETQKQTEKGKSSAASTETAAAVANHSAKSAGSEGSNEKSGMMAEGLKPVYFDFDRSFIRDDAKTVMQANAEWLKANPKVKVKIEGNCDERGSVNYNHALGARRAASAKKYLTEMGVSGHRISLISYGKEKPICGEHDESCWQKNRRDDFVAVGK